MSHAPTLLPRPRALAWAIFCSIGLVACGGGAGMVRATPTPPTPQSPPPASPTPPPPPPQRSLQLPPAPTTSSTPPAATAFDLASDPAFIERIDYFRTQLGSGFAYDATTGNYQFTRLPADFATLLQAKTAGSLVKQGNDSLQLFDTRFDGGVRLDAGTIQLWGDLHADVAIAPGATLDFANWADIIGDVDNQGILDATEQGGWYDDYYDGDIFGDYRQSAEGTLRVLLGLQSTSLATPLLSVSGRATLDGTLEFRKSGYVPSGSYLEWVLHARGGVFGQFSRWTSPGLLIDGTLRYDSNNVWLELTRVSVQVAMTTAGASALTLASAGNLDRALAGADLFASALPATLDPAQARFLQSAGRLLWVGDSHEAQRSLDSLAGSVHVDALNRATQGDALSSALSQRLLSLQPGARAGSWSRLGADGTVAGFDQWLGPRLLLGATTSEGNTTFGGQARERATQAALYLHWFGDGNWYAGGRAGVARHALTVDRPIDLGPGGRWNAHSQRGVSVATIDSEAGHRFNVGAGVLSPYAALGADVIRSERALEQGSTGFELALQANMQARLSAGLGLRYNRQWRLGERGWMRLDADARVQHGLADAGSPLQAAFIGVPDVGFALPCSQANTSGWLDVGLRGGTGSGLNWSLGHTGSFAGPSPTRQWLLALQRTF